MKLDFEFPSGLSRRQVTFWWVVSDQSDGCQRKKQQSSADRRQHRRFKLMNIRVGRRSLNHEETECRVEPAKEMIIAS
ncbi:MAG: hypothetical protein DWI00_13610 [Planctomycetota bacterium]|nr:MAG: hypothetical protein DWI00_13610 [Planctomycetota bacterium]